MRKNKSRLDSPGFWLGNKTGESIDIYKLLGGRPTPKKSGNPHSFVELTDSIAISRARKTLQLATKIAREEYYRRKRVRTKEYRKPVESQPVKPCNRRYFEHVGMKCSFLAYIEKPELFISKSKQAYEITDGLLSFLTTTSAREALIVCASLAKYGIAAYFNVVQTVYG